MITPSKFTTFDESILAKISYLIEDDIKEIPLSELLNKNKNKFNDISELIISLDVLYSLGKIEVDLDTRIVRYVD